MTARGSKKFKLSFAVPRVARGSRHSVATGSVSLRTGLRIARTTTGGKIGFDVTFLLQQEQFHGSRLTQAQVAISRAQWKSLTS